MAIQNTLDSTTNPLLLGADIHNAEAQELTDWVQYPLTPEQVDKVLDLLQDDLSSNPEAYITMPLATDEIMAIYRWHQEEVDAVIWGNCGGLSDFGSIWEAILYGVKGAKQQALSETLLALSADKVISEYEALFG